jgi:hypothetical protein
LRLGWADALGYALAARLRGPCLRRQWQLSSAVW